MKINSEEYPGNTLLTTMLYCWLIAAYCRLSPYDLMEINTQFEPKYLIASHDKMSTQRCLHLD